MDVPSHTSPAMVCVTVPSCGRVKATVYERLLIDGEGWRLSAILPVDW